MSHKSESSQPEKSESSATLHGGYKIHWDVTVGIVKNIRLFTYLIARCDSNQGCGVGVGVGVGVGRSRWFWQESDSESESVTTLFHYILPSQDGNKDGNRTLPQTADRRWPRWCVVYGDLSAGVAFVSG